MKIKRIKKLSEIKHMISIASDFFPLDQNSLDKEHVFLFNDVLYILLNPCENYPDIAEFRLYKNSKVNNDKEKEVSLLFTIFYEALKIAHDAGFKRIGFFAENKRLRNIYLKRKWFMLWGNGWLVSEEIDNGT